MKDPFKFWWLVLLKGIILIALAIFIFINPVEALVGLGIYIGIVLMITGILIISRTLYNHKTDDLFGWHLAEGIIDILFALVLLTNPAVTTAVFPFIVGFWIIIFGVMAFANAMHLMKQKQKQWWVSALGGLLNVIIGFLIITNPVIGALSITIWIGLGFLIYGILNVVIAFGLRKEK